MSARGERLDAAQAAADALQELDIDTKVPIDPFEAIRTLGLELVFAPLDKLLGAIVPSPAAASRSGVLITTERQASIQRFTAAHEIGHWYLDQDHLSIDLPIDTEQEIVGPTTNDRERRAQLFASYFLMPLPLVARTARRYGVVRRGTASAQQAYSIARDMHVSFEAAVRQLQNYNFISRNNAVDVLKTQPLRIKRELADGRPPTEARGDVWRMAVENNKACLEVFEGDDVVVALPENRTTGFRWLYSAPEIPDARPEPPPFDRAPLELDGPEVETPEPQEELVLPSDAPVGVVFDRFMMEDLPSGIATEGDESRTGGAGTRWIVLHAAEAGQWHEHLLYASPFRPDDAPVEDLSMYIAVRDKPAAESRRRWLSEFSKAELEG